ncbi:aminotransferase [Bacteroidia bacterium]|nr:aminotransferase [Bacteroidia bacterium]GHT82238.1 aminotransferase [Bacteroidia bacterium]
MYNFDEIIDLHGANALKTDVLEQRYGRSDLLPLWVADMDFRTPDFILDALRKRIEHPILGYTIAGGGFNAAITDWLQQRHHWNVNPQHLSFVPGIVKAISYCVNFFTQCGDKIIIQPPVYHPFKMVIEGNDRVVVNNSLQLAQDKYSMDFDLLESQMDERCKMLVLCNPHNPAGVVWDAETLRTLAKICAKHKVLVVADEIHADLILQEIPYTPFVTTCEEAAQNSITLRAASKTFNIAGLFGSYSITPNDTIRRQWHNYLSINEFNEGTIFSYIATEAAYRNGHQWVQELLVYLRDNVAFIDNYLRQNIPHIKAVLPQATYLMWLDCRALGLSQSELVSLFVNKARLALNSGTIFGAEGEGFMRLNFATPRKNLETALERLKVAVNS